MLAAMAPADLTQEGPDAAPISVSRSFYGAANKDGLQKIQIDVVLGDVLAQTRIYVSGALVQTLTAGTASYPTGQFTLGTIGASHFKNGVETEVTPET
jgi:hypothetical protein